MSYYGEMVLVRELRPGQVFYDPAASSHYQLVVAVDPDGDIVVVRSHPIRESRTRLLWSEQRDHYQIGAKVQEIKEPWQ